jgi:hypothetical protein
MGFNTDLAVRIATVLDNRGITKADKAIKGLEKTSKSLGRTLGVSLGAAAIVAFGKKAVTAFSADEKAAVQLNQALKNLGLGFASATSAQFISDLEKSANIADDQLRPAFQALITTTGSLTKSQELLNLAIETSRGSTVDLVQVSQDIANAYIGNTKGIRKYYLGLTQAELKTASFTEIQAKLNEQFSGSNAAYLNTTAGKMEAIGVAAGNAAEVIGGSLVDALITASGSNGIQGLVDKIDSIAGAIAGAIREFQEFAFITAYTFNPKNFFKGSEGFKKALQDFQKRQQYQGTAGFDAGNNSVTGFQRDNAARIKAEKDAKARALALVNATKKNTAELKKQAALKKAGTIFDLDRAGILAALQGKISDEERKRLELQLALLDGNVTEAEKLSKQVLMAQDATGKLYAYFQQTPEAKNPFGYLDEWILSFQKKMNDLQFPLFTTDSAASRGAISSNVPTGGIAAMTPSSGATSAAGNSFNVYVAGSIISDDDLLVKIEEGLQKSSLSGSPSQIGRVLGMFS